MLMKHSPRINCEPVECTEKTVELRICCGGHACGPKQTKQVKADAGEVIQYGDLLKAGDARGYVKKWVFGTDDPSLIVGISEGWVDTTAEGYDESCSVICMVYRDAHVRSHAIQWQGATNAEGCDIADELDQRLRISVHATL